MKKKIIINALFAGAAALSVSIPLLSTGADAFAATGGKTASNAIAWVRSKVGQGIDFDKYNGNQCVDLIKAYYKYLGAPEPFGNGADYTHNATPAGWKRYQGVQPKKGDILVYTGGSGGYGHVAIYESDYSHYHQNFNFNSYVEHVTYKYNGNWDIKYWGVIRPDFSAEKPSHIAVTGIKLNTTSVSLSPGEPFALKATVLPSNATNKGVSWSSSNKSVVSVDSSGNIKALKTGTAVITAKTSDGGKTATAKITVKLPKNGLAKVGGVWKYYVNGKLNTSYTGLAKNLNGWWYCKKGVVDYSYTGLAKSTDGKWYYAKNGKWDKSYTGFAKSPVNGRWYFVKSGRLDLTYTGLAYNRSNGGWFYARKGLYDSSFTGISVSTNGKYYYVSKGKWIKSYNGKVRYNGKTYTIRKGAVV